jgi:urease accessory protein
MPAEELHHAVALGVVARAAAMNPVEAARWAAYESITGAATAAVRLLGLDPFTVWRAVSALASTVDEIAQAPTRSLGELPSCSAPLLDVGAERHALQEVRLFAS